jgi:DNA-binding Xre family transcriptional regulator
MAVLLVLKGIHLFASFTRISLHGHDESWPEGMVNQELTGSCVGGAFAVGFVRRYFVKADEMAQPGRLLFSQHHKIGQNMIRNEWQLKITKSRVAEFESALNKLTEATASSKALRVKMQADSLSSDIQKMRAEVAEYEKLKRGKVKVLTAKTFHELPEVIIKARIARSMTQKQLAESLGMKEQQIQRYESSNYASVSFSKIERIIEALGITVEEKVTLG